jgi:uncharacterized membrane protein
VKLEVLAGNLRQGFEVRLWSTSELAHVFTGTAQGQEAVRLVADAMNRIAVAYDTWERAWANTPRGES